MAQPSHTPDGPMLRVCAHGPLLVRGSFVLEDELSGTTTEVTGPMALCRCGKTAQPPWCDASHKNGRPRKPARDE